MNQGSQDMKEKSNRELEYDENRLDAW